MAQKGNLLTAVIYFIFFGFPLAYIMIWGLFNDQYTLNVGLIFSLMGILAFNISSLSDKIGFTSLISPKFSSSALSFTAGSLLLFILGRIGNLTGSVTTFSTAGLLSTASQNIPDNWSILVNSVGAGFGEEGLFLGAILIIILIIQESLPNNWNTLKSGWITFIVFNLTSIPLFILYHTGRDLTGGFILMGILFRLLVSSFVVFEVSKKKIDLIPGIVIGISFAVGAHVTNNLINLGAFNLDYMLGSIPGLIVFSLYALNLAGAIYWIINKLR